MATVTFLFTGCYLNHSGIIEGVNISGITIKATIDGDTKTLANNTSEVWTIKLDDTKTVSGKIVSTRGKVFFEGDLTIKKDERIRLTFDAYGNVIRD